MRKACRLFETRILPAPLRPRYGALQISKRLCGVDRPLPYCSGSASDTATCSQQRPLNMLMAFWALFALFLRRHGYISIWLPLGTYVARRIAQRIHMQGFQILNSQGNGSLPYTNATLRSTLITFRGQTAYAAEGVGRPNSCKKRANIMP
jgi:hypothetical protein